MYDYFACIYVMCTVYMPKANEGQKEALEVLDNRDVPCRYWKPNPGQVIYQSI